MTSDQFEIKRRKSRKRKMNWQLVMIGDQGKVICIQKYRSIAVSLLVLMVITITLSISLFYLFHKNRMEIQSLKDSLKLSDKLVDSLKAEKEVLAARLIVAGIEPDLERVRNEDSKANPGIPSSKRGENDRINSLGQNSQVATAIVDKGDQEKSANERKKNIQNWREKSDLAIISDFVVSKDSNHDRLRLQFKLSNISAQRLSGYLFVVLKDLRKPSETWLISPKESLEGGFPADFKSGRNISISRFKTIKFEIEQYQSLGKVFQADILIFNNGGQLILKYEFPVEI